MCYLCGSTTETLATRKEIRFECFASDKNIVRCRLCGLVQLFPQWTLEELDQLYQKYWSKEDFKGQKRKVKISKYLTKYIYKSDRVLEIGCGHGDNIVYLVKQGVKNIQGIDKDPNICGGRIINFDVKDYKPEEKFDMIYVIHLLEHLPDPKSFIVWILRNLTDTGRFVLEVPCLNDPLRELYNSKSYKKFCWYPYHLFFYDHITIQRLFGNVFRDPFVKMPKMTFELKQEYGLINHLRWLLFGKPGNWNPHIPFLDDIYKHILVKMGFGDTLVVVGQCLT